MRKKVPAVVSGATSEPQTQPEPPRLVLDSLCVLSVGLLVLYEQAHVLPSALVAYAAAYLVFPRGGPDRR